MNFGIAKQWSRAVLVTAVAGLVLSSGCGGGGGENARTRLFNSYVAVKVTGFQKDGTTTVNQVIESPTPHLAANIGYKCRAPLDDTGTILINADANATPFAYDVRGVANVMNPLPPALRINGSKLTFLADADCGTNIGTYDVTIRVTDSNNSASVVSAVIAVE